MDEETTRNIPCKEYFFKELFSWNSKGLNIYHKLKIIGRVVHVKQIEDNISSIQMKGSKIIEWGSLQKGKLLKVIFRNMEGK